MGERVEYRTATGRAVLLDRAHPTTKSGLKGQLVVAPEGSDQEVIGVLFCAPTATFGDSQDYAEGNAWVVLRDDDGVSTTRVRARMTYDGHGGMIALHVSPGVNGDDSAPSQAVWINPQIDSCIPLAIDQVPASIDASPVSALLVIRDGAATPVKRLEFDAAYQLFLWNDAGSAAGVALYAATTPAFGARAILNTLTAATMGLFVNGLAAGTQTGDLQRWANNNVIGTRVDDSGYIMTRKSAAPADGDLANGESAWWTDGTAGAPEIKFKGKDSAGTVFERTVGLSTPIVKSSGSLTATGSLTEDVLATISTSGRYTLSVDLEGLSPGDTTVIRQYGKARTGDTERLIDTVTVYGEPSDPLLQMPTVVSPHHAKFSIACSAARTIPWAVYQD